MASMFSPKARQWVRGRKHIFAEIQKALEGNTAPVIWFHCASLGEFEQGRPVMEKFKAAHPDYKVLLTFFSPSGYEVRKDYKGANYIFYLPVDSRAHAQKFLALTQPRIAVFVKYEFWHYYIDELYKRSTPLLLISGIFREGQVFFKPTGTFYRNMLRRFTRFFVQNPHSRELLESIGIDNVTIAGDTRFDRVLEIAAQWSPVPYLDSFCADAPVLVAGSTWPEDESVLKNFFRIHTPIKCVIAPHEITPEHIAEIRKKFPHTVLYSQLREQKEDMERYQTLIIDNIGMLSRLYRYATVAYVGGGWGQSGIHNVLEAAVYGKPVLCGPHHRKSVEVQALVDGGGAFAAADSHALELKLNELFAPKSSCEKMADRAATFVRQNAGATTKIVKYLNELLAKPQ